jgi:tetratricopeptide (TPR) repeat protein
MGVVYRAIDTVFGREVAVKVLADRYAPTSGTARRFRDEARITGQLQHPGIPPAHDLGTLPDGRPFLVMKLIKGETLDDLLGGQPERGRLVAAFEQVCQAVGYAHAHRVIHRDLKPSNVMVGYFGEVQVMDWGLAKVLDEPPGVSGPGGDPDATDAGTVVRSLRDGEDQVTQAGSVLGTPAYMPPEQALGAVHEVDARSDVFGLGGILAAILTGRPPFVGETAETTRVMAARGEVAGCFARLDLSGADPELAALCKRCLAPRRDDRPADAGVVAREVGALRAAADERARQAELDRVKAEGERAAAAARDAERRKRRRLWLGTAALLLLVITAGSAVTAALVWREKEATAGEWRRAEHERERAEGNFAIAWDLTTGLFGMVARIETGHADPPSDAERKVWLDRVAAASERFLADAPDDPDQLLRVARLHRFAANLSRLLNDTQGAERAYQDAVRTQSLLAGRFPDDPAQRERLCHTLRDQAVFLRRVGRLTEAEQSIDRSAELAAGLRASAPSRPDYLRTEALARLDQSEIRSARGRFAEAEAAASEAASLFDDLLGTGPNDRHPLDPVFRGMASIQTAKARRDQAGPTASPDALGPAMHANDEAVGLLRTVAQSSKDRDSLHNYYRALIDRSRTAVRVPARQREAVDHLAKAIEGWAKLAEQHPQTPMYREGLGTAYLLRGRLRADSGDPAGAAADLGAALKLLEELVRSALDLPGYRALLGEVWVGRAGLAADPAELDLCVDRALSSFRAARNREADNPAHARALEDVARRWPEAAARVAAKRNAKAKP